MSSQKEKSNSKVGNFAPDALQLPMQHVDPAFNGPERDQTRHERNAVILRAQGDFSLDGKKRDGIASAELAREQENMVAQQ